MLAGRHYLALDQSIKQIGYAIGSPDMVEPVCGSWSPPTAGARHGVMLSHVRDWLDGIIKHHRIFKVIFEAPFVGKRPAAHAVVCKMIGVIELVCMDHDIPCVEVTSGEWRKQFFGAVRAPKAIPKSQRRAWLKGQAIGACNDRGWQIGNDDEADAAGILNFVLHQDSEHYRMRNWDG